MDTAVMNMSEQELRDEVERLRAQYDAKHQPPTKAQLEQMLIRENELRLCDETQAKFEKADKLADDGIIQEVVKLQEQVAEEFGFFGKKKDIAVDWLRCAGNVYPDLAHIPLYVRLNRCHDGYLKAGDVAPNAKLFTLQGQETSLHDTLNAKIPTLVISGSWS